MPEPGEESDIVYGRNPVKELLKSGREINRLLVTSHAPQGIIDAAKDRKIVLQFVEKSVLDRHAGGENHQGVLAFVSPYRYAEMEEVLAYADSKGEKPFLLVLDGITDPHNLGSMIRTADATGVHGILLPKRGSALLNRTAVKVSSGAAEHVKVVRVTNLAQTMEDLKKRGIWFVGTAFGERTYTEVDMTGGIAVVIGSEGEGMSRLVKEKCDFLVSIPMLGEVDSLNASVAAGVILYEAVRQNQKKKTDL